MIIMGGLYVFFVVAELKGFIWSLGTLVSCFAVCNEGKASMSGPFRATLSL